MSTPSSGEIRQVAFELSRLADWMDRNPDSYDADAEGQKLEQLGLLTPDHWEPTQWVLDAVAALRSGA